MKKEITAKNENFMVSVKNCQQEISMMMKNLNKKANDQFMNDLVNVESKMTSVERLKIAQQLEYQK